METELSSAAVETASAQRVRFVESSSASDGLQAFVDPYPRMAVGETAPVDDVLSIPPCHPPEEELLLVSLPAGAATPVEVQRQAEQWMTFPAPSTALPAIDLVLQSDRILWRPGRAVVIGAGRRWPEIRTGLIAFSFYEAELRRLEEELQGDWNLAEADVALTHTVDMQSVSRRSHVDRMTRATALRRIRFARLSPRLEKSPAALPGIGRRLFSELALQTEVVDRLKYVDDRLEVYENLYELANDRLADYSYYRAEYRLEAWIIALLVLEVVLMLGEMWLAWRMP